MSLKQPWFRSNQVIALFIPFTWVGMGFAQARLGGTTQDVTRVVFVIACLCLFAWMGFNARWILERSAESPSDSTGVTRGLAATTGVQDVPVMTGSPAMPGSRRHAADGPARPSYGVVFRPNAADGPARPSYGVVFRPNAADVHRPDCPRLPAPTSA